MQDAYNLGWKLAAVLNGAPAELLDSYEAERRPIAADVLGMSTGLLTQMQQGVMRRGREVHQLDLSYAGGPLAPADGKRAVAAGDRAPDAEFSGAGGKRRRLFDLLAGPHWTLLQYGRAQNEIKPRLGLRIHAIGERLELRDEERQFQNAYGLKGGDRILIRPDGYIGMIDAGAPGDDLENYLAAVGLAEPGA